MILRILELSLSIPACLVQYRTLSIEISLFSKLVSILLVLGDPALLLNFRILSFFRDTLAWYNEVVYDRFCVRLAISA